MMSKKRTNNNVFEIQFYENLLKKRPSFVEALVALGDLYTKEGMLEKGLAADLTLSQMKPDDPIVLYNLACSYSLLNQIDLSLETIKRAIALGYEDLNYIIQDEDLTNLRRDSRFNEFFMNLKK